VKTDPKLTREQQWTRNSYNRRRAIVAAGGRQLILVLEKEHADQLAKLVEMRRKNDPSLSITGWLRKMIVADLKDQVRRRTAGGKVAKGGDH
jgi:hypothetical protein